MAVHEDNLNSVLAGLLDPSPTYEYNSERGQEFPKGTTVLLRDSSNRPIYPVAAHTEMLLTMVTELSERLISMEYKVTKLEKRLAEK